MCELLISITINICLQVILVTLSAWSFKSTIKREIYS